MQNLVNKRYISTLVVITPRNSFWFILSHKCFEKEMKKGDVMVSPNHKAIWTEHQLGFCSVIVMVKNWAVKLDPRMYISEV